VSRDFAPVALVTGGGRRIGAVLAERLAASGYTVVITYRTARAEAVDLARRLAGRAWRLDLACPGTFAALAGRLGRRFGRLDLLVHNAAVFPRTPPGSVKPRLFDRVVAVNLRGPFLLTQALIPLMRRTPGRPAVVFIGDAGARAMWPSYLPYCLSKMALEGLAAAWRRDLAPAIRVGLVRPGFALRPEGFPLAAWEALQARRPKPRGPSSPGEIAAAVLRFARAGFYNRELWTRSSSPGGHHRVKETGR